MNIDQLIRRMRRDDRTFATDPGDGSKWRRVFERALDLAAKRRAADPAERARRAAVENRNVLAANNLTEADFM